MGEDLTLDQREIRRRGKDLYQRYIGGDPQRAKLVAVCTLFVVALLCFIIRVGPALRFRPRAQELHSAAWNMVHDLNAALSAKPAFADAGFSVESEDPLKLRLSGGVRTRRDLDDLQAFVKELRPGRPDDEVEVDVVILQR